MNISTITGGQGTNTRDADTDVVQAEYPAESPTFTQILDAGINPAHTNDNALAQDHDAINDELLDSETLQVLGDDPTATVAYGKEVHKELVNRFEHITTSGLTKETRKELCDKYLVPSNCTRIGAPKLNPEIKAALNESLVKRDKIIEAKQKQIAAAVACLAQIATEQLSNKNINHDLLRKIMDAGCLICDVQHTESTTRKNFAAFSLKKDMKEHLLNTKVDTSLFGETLPETLKSAKAVCKTGNDLKVNTSSYKKPRPSTSTQKPQPTKNLNWKTPAPARRQPGPSRGRRLLRSAARPRRHRSSRLIGPDRRAASKSGKIRWSTFTFS